MSGWRPATQRPRDGQAIVAHFSDCGIVTGEFQRRRSDGPTFHCDTGWDASWTEVVAWIPERELIKQARAAGKVKQ